MVPIAKLMQLKFFQIHSRELEGLNPRHEIHWYHAVSEVRLLLRLLEGEDVHISGWKKQSSFCSLLYEYADHLDLQCCGRTFEVEGYTEGWSPMSPIVDHPILVLQPYRIQSTNNIAVCQAFVDCMNDGLEEIDSALAPEFLSLCEELIVNVNVEFHGHNVRIPVKKLKKIKDFADNPGRLTHGER